MFWDRSEIRDLYLAQFGCFFCRKEKIKGVGYRLESLTCQSCLESNSRYLLLKSLSEQKELLRSKIENGKKQIDIELEYVQRELLLLSVESEAVARITRNVDKTYTLQLYQREQLIHEASAKPIYKNDLVSPIEKMAGRKRCIPWKMIDTDGEWVGTVTLSDFFINKLIQQGKSYDRVVCAFDQQRRRIKRSKDHFAQL